MGILYFCLMPYWKYAMNFHGIEKKIWTNKNSEKNHVDRRSPSKHFSYISKEPGNSAAKGCQCKTKMDPVKSNPLYFLEKNMNSWTFSLEAWNQSFLVLWSYPSRRPKRVVVTPLQRHDVKATTDVGPRSNTVQIENIAGRGDIAFALSTIYDTNCYTSYSQFIHRLAISLLSLTLR